MMSIDTPSDRVGPTSPGTSSLESQRPLSSGTTDSALDERGERTPLGSTYAADHNPPVVELLTETSTPVPSAVSRTSLREVTQHGSHDPSVAPSLAAARHDESKYDNNSTTAVQLQDFCSQLYAHMHAHVRRAHAHPVALAIKKY